MIFKNALITGANRGIGLEFVKQIIQHHQPTNVFACCRNPQAAEELQNLKRNSAQTSLHIFQLDVCNEGQISAAAKYVEETVQAEGLNVLINNAGILEKRQSFPKISADAMQKHFLTNSTGPLLVTEKFLPLLKHAAQKDSANTMSCSKASVINISAHLGSVELTRSSAPGFLPYSASKAALNMVMRHVAVNVKNDNVLVVNFHPGWVKTDMGGPQATLEISHSVSQMLKTMTTLNKGHHGSFLNFDGKKIPF